MFMTVSLRSKTVSLELRQYDNKVIQTQINFENFALFHRLYSEGKSAAISELELLWTEWSCFKSNYITKWVVTLK